MLEECAEQPTPGTLPATVMSPGGFARAPAPPMSLVAPNLHVGDEAAAASLHVLHEAGITHVLNCTHLPNALEGVAGAPAYLQLGLRDHVSDSPMLQSAFAAGVEFITAALASGGSVLVHCRAGISRSPTLAVAYLVSATRQPVEQVFERMRTQRHIIDPNLTYWVALQEWERRVLLSPSAPCAGANAAHTTPPFAAAPPRVRPLSRVG